MMIDGVSLNHTPYIDEGCIDNEYKSVLSRIVNAYNEDKLSREDFVEKLSFLKQYRVTAIESIKGMHRTLIDIAVSD